MVALPDATPVTTPFDTVAIEVLLLLHDTVLSVAFAGSTVSVSCTVSATSIEAVDGLTETLVTWTTSVTYVIVTSAP